MLVLLSIFGCPRAEPEGPPTPISPPLSADLLDAISLVRIRADVDLLAHDDRGGRVPGSPGHAFTRDYLAAEMSAAGLEPRGTDGFVTQHDLQLERSRRGLDASGAIYDVPLAQPGYNLVGAIPGTDPALAAEVVLLVAHYDHLGVDETGDPYNGAFDDITAVCALLELARVMGEQQVALPRTVAFLFTDAEEDGLDGAAAWVEDPTVPLPDIVAALSVDPIGRGILPDWGPLMVIGAERSPGVLQALESIDPFVAVPVYRANRTPLLGFASDQDAFWTAPDAVPALWITSGGMSFYHTVDDDPETIDYGTVREHLGAVAQLAAELARTVERPFDLGEQPLSVDDMQQAVDLLDGALGSSELTDDERALADDFRRVFDGAVIADDASQPLTMAKYAELMLYVITDLTPAHPGPIPPPFPE